MSPKVGKKRSLMSMIQGRETSNKHHKLSVFKDSELYEVYDNIIFSEILSAKKDIKMYILKVDKESVYIDYIADNLSEFSQNNFNAQRSPISDLESPGNTEYYLTYQFSAVVKRKNDKSSSLSDDSYVQGQIINAANIYKVYINKSLNRLYFLEELNKKSKMWVEVLKNNYNIDLIKKGQPEWKTFMKSNKFSYASYFSKSKSLSGSGSGSKLDIITVIKKLPLTKLKAIAKNRSISLTRKKDNKLVQVSRITLEKRIIKHIHNHQS